MVRSICKAIGLAIGLCAVAGIPSPAQARGAAEQLAAIAKAMPGLNDSERTRLDRALQVEFQGVAEMSSGTFGSVQGVINAGLFEMSENTGDEDGPMSDGDLMRVAHVSRAAYQAIANGADPNLAEDLALVGFAREITAGQIQAAARALSRFMGTRIAVDTYQEIISQALDNGWAPEATQKVSDGLIRGAEEGLDAEKLALVLIIGVAQDLASRDIDRVVREALTYVRTRKDPAYEALQGALQAGLAPPVGRELYYISVEETWSSEVVEGIFRGMVRGQKMGLTPEKLATALIVRVAQGLEGVPIAQVVQEEIDYVRKLERQRIEQIQSDPRLKKTYQTAGQWTQLAYIPPKAEVSPPAVPPKESTPEELVAQLEPIYRSLMEQSIQDYLGTPYKWGGTAKKRGTDCSGFTQGVYRDGGIRIPRVSRVQYRRTPLKLGRREELIWGDLVFFNKNGGPDSYITHVGLYLGKDEGGIERFVQSSTSKGVTVSRFNKRYYLSRFVGGARPADVQR